MKKSPVYFSVTLKAFMRYGVRVEKKKHITVIVKVVVMNTTKTVLLQRTVHMLIFISLSLSMAISLSCSSSGYSSFILSGRVQTAGAQRPKDIAAKKMKRLLKSKAIVITGPRSFPIPLLRKR